MMISKETIEGRLQELETEIGKGQEQLNTLEQRREEIRATMLRLSGAAQVLTELLGAADSPRTSGKQPKVVSAS